MRKIDKSADVPRTLQNAPTPKNADEVDEKFYRANDVRKQLLEDQHGKCAYCECRITKEYNDVEHYRPKSTYYWLGHDWNNLLYSCPLCNRSYKNDDFPLANEANRVTAPDNIANEEPLIVNPAMEEPTIHIRFNRHIMVGITAKGEKTIEMFKLNKRDTLLNDRKILFERYGDEIRKKRFAEMVLEIPNLSEEIYNDANTTIELCTKEILSCKSMGEPHSGMLVNQ